MEEEEEGIVTRKKDKQESHYAKPTSKRLSSRFKSPTTSPVEQSSQMEEEEDEEESEEEIEREDEDEEEDENDSKSHQKKIKGPRSEIPDGVDANNEEDEEEYDDEDVDQDDANVKYVEKEEEEDEENLKINEGNDDDRIQRYRLKKRVEQLSKQARLKAEGGIDSKEFDHLHGNMSASHGRFFSLKSFDASKAGTIVLDFANAEHSDKEIAALIHERMLRVTSDVMASTTRLFVDLSGNYAGIQSIKQLLALMRNLPSITELSMNFKNTFIWMDFILLGRVLQTHQQGLKSLHLNLRDTKIETFHLVDFVQSLNTLENLEQLVLDISKNTFLDVDDNYFTSMKYRNLRVPQLALFLNEVDLEQDSVQSVVNLLVKKNPKLVSLFLASNSDINRVPLNNLIGYLLKKPNLSELMLRFNITDLKRKKLTDILTSCCSATPAKLLHFQLTGKIIGSALDDFGMIATSCSNLVKFIVELTEIRDTEQESLIRFVQLLRESAKTTPADFKVILKENSCSNDVKIADNSGHFDVVFV